MNTAVRLMYLNVIQTKIYKIMQLEKENEGNFKFSPDKRIELQCQYYQLFGLLSYLENALINA